MTNWKTTVLGVLKLLGALGFVAFKLANGMAFTDAEAGVVLLALGSGFSGIVSADAKPVEPK